MCYVSTLCFLFNLFAKKKKGRNHIKLLLATLLATLDHHILYYTTKRDRTHHLWEKIFPKHI